MEIHSYHSKWLTDNIVSRETGSCEVPFENRYIWKCDPIQNIFLCIIRTKCILLNLLVYQQSHLYYLALSSVIGSWTWKNLFDNDNKISQEKYITIEGFYKTILSGDPSQGTGRIGCIGATCAIAAEHSIFNPKYTSLESELNLSW